MKKKGALELSIGTIVIIVIAMSLLILGIILVRQVMCAGIILTEQVTTETESEIVNLFGTSRAGIDCVGEGNNIPTFGSKGLVPVMCLANFDTDQTCDLVVSSVKVTSGRIGTHSESTQDLKNTELVLAGYGLSSYSIKATPTDLKVATLNLPSDVEKSSIKIIIQETCGGAQATHDVDYLVEPVGSFTSAIC